MGSFEQRGCADRKAAPRCSNPEIRGAARSDISTLRALRHFCLALTIGARPCKSAQVPRQATDWRLTDSKELALRVV